MSIEENTLILDNVITGNSAGVSGGGIHGGEWGSLPIVIRNTILRDNDAVEGYEIWLDTFQSLTIEYSDIQGDEENVWSEWSELDWGPGNIDADPLFVLPDQDDYRLLWRSPCIDTGDPDVLDPDGTRSDIGARYFDQNEEVTLYLTPDTTDVVPGEELGLTCTLINRWSHPETFDLEGRVILPDGTEIVVYGPENFDLPGGHTTQFHTVHEVPGSAPAGWYDYAARTLFSLARVPGEDRFRFRVVEP